MNKIKINGDKNSVVELAEEAVQYENINTDQMESQFIVSKDLLKSLEPLEIKKINNLT